MISRIIAGELELEETDIYFTCGLLHDLGRAVMDISFPMEWQKIQGFAEKHECSLIAAERQFGFPHNVIGAWLAKNWELPPVYPKVIASHHIRPGHPHFNMDGAIIQLADHLSHELGIGLNMAPSCNKVVLANYLGLGQEKIEFLEEHIKKIGEIAEAISTGML